MTWGSDLRAARRRAGYTQRQLGEAIASGLGERWTPNRAQQFVSLRERDVPMRSVAAAHRAAQALSGIFGLPMPPPPVDEQEGSRRGARRGGDSQRERRTRFVVETVCPKCGEHLDVEVEE